jgi:succinate dehydrogenase / fumarate reductase flavoprotein subunit
MGEANFSDHGANRLGASALMQGLADGYFVAPATVGNYLASEKPAAIHSTPPELFALEKECAENTKRLLAINGKRTVDDFHRQLGLLMWDKCGMARNEQGLKEAIDEIPAIREEFWTNVRILGDDQSMNQSLEKAGRVADFLEFAELLVTDALNRDESCGGHFREEHQTDEGEAKRDDDNFCHVSAWEFSGDVRKPVLHKEELDFEVVHLATRSYK